MAPCGGRALARERAAEEEDREQRGEHELRLVEHLERDDLEVAERDEDDGVNGGLQVDGAAEQGGQVTDEHRHERNKAQRDDEGRPPARKLVCHPFLGSPALAGPLSALACGRSAARAVGRPA